MVVARYLDYEDIKRQPKNIDLKLIRGCNDIAIIFCIYWYLPCPLRSLSLSLSLLIYLV